MSLEMLIEKKIIFFSKVTISPDGDGGNDESTHPERCDHSTGTVLNRHDH